MFATKKSVTGVTDKSEFVGMIEKTIVGAAIGSPLGNARRNGRPMGAPTL